MKRIKVLVIPADTAEPVRQELIDTFPIEGILSELIFGEGITDGTVGEAGFGPTHLFFDETAGDRDDRDEIINPRANVLWNHLAASRGSALSYADDEPLYGTFIAVGHGTGSVTDDDSSTDVSEEIIAFATEGA